MANVDPFVAPIPRKFLEDPELRPFFEYLNRFLHDLFIRSGGGDDEIEVIMEVAAAEADIPRIAARVTALEKRIIDLEESNDTDSLRSKIAKLNQKVNKLIKELIAAVKDLAPDKEQESDKVVLLQNILHETQLLSARIEEAFETEITGDDV